MSYRTSWAAQQLAEFLAIVSSYPDVPCARQGGLERAAEAVEAEVATWLCGPEVLATIGYPAGELPTDTLVSAVAQGEETCVLPGLGEVHLAAMATADATLVFARAGEPFARDELGVLRAMVHVLRLALDGLERLDTERVLRERSEHQAVENAELLSSLEMRQRVMGTLSDIQRAICRREPLEWVLDRVLDGVHMLVESDIIGLTLTDADDEDYLTLVATRGIDGPLLEAARRTPRGEGIRGRAIASGHLVVEHDYATAPDRLGVYAAAGVTSAMACPVWENERAIGSLVVASLDAEHRFSPTEQSMLELFAEHASLALTDAHTLAEVQRALHDPLTGLPNRRLFLDRTAQAIAESMESSAPMAVLFLDLNRFKLVNDSLGHSFGDELLGVVGGRIHAAIRASDCAARIGGDEFAVLLTPTSPSESERTADRLLEVLRQPIRIGTREIFIDASIGIATSTPGEPAVAADLLRRADMAMYRAKHDHRRPWSTFQPSMEEDTLARLELEVDLQRALGGGEFVLHYQPVVRLADGGIVGAEALVRWQHPTRGLIPPGGFIELAEETGLIVPMGLQVLGAAVAQAARWTGGDRPDLRISVNLSSRQLDLPSIADDVALVLLTGGLAPDKLCLEITESALLHDPSAAMAQLTRLRDLGVRIALDDFGTGYSSLSYLEKLPVDVLKIDRSFVRQLRVDTTRLAVVRAIIDLAKALDLDVVAEGIEDRREAELLEGLGCEMAQGYLFSRPVTTRAFEALAGLERAPLPVPG